MLYECFLKIKNSKTFIAKIGNEISCSSPAFVDYFSKLKWISQSFPILVRYEMGRLKDPFHLVKSCMSTVTIERWLIYSYR